MFGIDFGYHHGNVVCEAVRGVVGNDGDFEAGIFFFERLDFFLLHINGAKDKVDLSCKRSGVFFRV